MDPDTVNKHRNSSSERPGDYSEVSRVWADTQEVTWKDTAGESKARSLTSRAHRPRVNTRESTA